MITVDVSQDTNNDVSCNVCSRKNYSKGANLEVMKKAVYTRTKKEGDYFDSDSTLEY